MTPKALLAAAGLALVLAAPARAEREPDPFAQIESLLASGALLRGVVQDEDVTLVFDHLRAALLAASQGREAPPAPEPLVKRGEEIAGDLKARGTAFSLLLINAFESAARQALRDSPLLAQPPASQAH